MTIALCQLLNTGLSYFGIDLPALSFFAGTSFLSLTLLYLVSYAFGFCAYHRMFLHYTVADNLLCIYDYYCDIPMAIRTLLLMHFILAGVFLFIILLLYVRSHQETIA